MSDAILGLPPPCPPVGWNDIRLEQLESHSLLVPVWRSLYRVGLHPVLQRRQCHFARSHNSAAIGGLRAALLVMYLQLHVCCFILRANLVPGRERHNGRTVGYQLSCGARSINCCIICSWCFSKYPSKKQITPHEAQERER